jgi:hypothetical protein
MYSHISAYGAFLLDMHTRLHLELPVEATHSMHEHGAAQVIGSAVQPPRGARTRVQRLALFNVARSLTTDSEGVRLRLVTPMWG